MSATETFLRLIWPEAGAKTVASIKDGKVHHHWFEPNDIPAAALKAASLSKEGKDVYMAVGGFKEHQRQAEHAEAFRTLFLDIDCGEGKEYPDQETARAALDEFVTTTQLPIPFVVSSGYGLHIYWPFDVDICKEEWLALAQALKYLCKQQQLRTDERCTADAARILRPLGTKNYKNGTPQRVQIISAGTITAPEDIKAVLEKHAANVFETIAAQAQKAKPLTTQFDNNVPADFDSIIPRCATLRYAYEHQDEVREPLWYAAVGLANFCEAPSETAYRLSEKHPAFDPITTDAKRMQWLSAVGGPPTCDYFRTCPGNLCSSCPESVSTPIHLGKPRGTRLTFTQLISNKTRFTDDYIKVGGHGLMVQQTPKPDANGNLPAQPTWIKIANQGMQPLLNLKLPDKDGNPLNYIWMESHDDSFITKHNFVVPATSVNNSSLFAAECAKHGVINEQEVSPVSFKIFTTIMRNWINKLMQQQKSIVTFDSFGWMGVEGTHIKDSFLLGDKLYTKEEVRTVPTLPHLREYQNEMVSQGTLEAWTAAIDNYNIRGMEAYMFTSWSAWAAPLMRFTGSQNLVVSLVGETGVGKSSLQRAIASVYGRTQSNVLVDQHDSTINSINASLGCLNSLPYIREEASENNHEELASWVLTMTQGRDRGRLNQNLAKVPVKTWATLAVISSNTSIREIVINTRRDNAARLARTWEAYFKLPIPPEEASRLFRPLWENYGHAGPIFIDYVVKNQEAVQRMVRETEDALMKKFRATGSDRFHISFMAACFVGAQLAIQLGLINHIFKRGRDYAYKQYLELHQSAIDEQQTPEQVLASMVQEMRPNTLIVEMDNPANATTIFDSNNNIIYAPSANSVINARYATDTSSFYVSTLAIRKWYVDNHVNYHTAMVDLKAKGILIEEGKKVVMTRGTKLADKKQTRVSWFDLSQSEELTDVMKRKMQ